MAVDRLTARVGHAVGRVLTMVLLSGVFVLIIVPASVLTFPFRRRVMGRPRGVDGWMARAPAAPRQVRRAHGSDPRRRPLRIRHAVGRVAWIVLLAMALDLVLGGVLSGSRVLLGDRAQLREVQREAWNEAMRAPAIRDEPWADQYRRDQDDLAAKAQEYLPYLVWGFQQYHSRWVNTSDRERRSYVPDTAPGVRPLRVAFFGGSVLFGIGQRDDYTIPSQFARTAERAGIPVEVHNYGMFGWVRWQEYQYLERLLAADERYDLIVFYDGLNDYMVQFSDPSTDPTHGGSRILMRLGADVHRDAYSYPGFFDGFGDLARTYRENSGVARIVDRVVNGPTGLPDWLASSAPVDANGASDAALDIYGRSGRAIELLADDAGIPVRSYMQATKIEWTPEQRAQFPPGTRDYSDIFDGIESSIYIDGAHTNERGARMVAERLWRDLGPELRLAYASRPSAGGD